jgi:diacylglycerol kinase family enzyme
VYVTADDKEYDGHMIFIAIGNGKYFGGGMNICPDAKLDDGLFEVCLVSDVSKLKFIREISKVYSGRLGELKEVIYLKAKTIKIEVQGTPYFINADGNLMGITPANISIIEKSVFIYTKGETV